MTASAERQPAPGGRRGLARRFAWGLLSLVVLLGAGAFLLRVEIQRALLDPGVPYPVYKPPPAPDYSRRSAWALLPADPQGATGPGADIFFVHGTTYNGGREWNAPIGEPEAERFLQRAMIPNYAGPFQSVGRVFAPRYRQASLYSISTLRDDARDARRFPLRDIEAALAAYLERWNRGRPVILVGVGQGGELLSRALEEALARAPALKQRIAAVYLIHVIAPADAYGPAAPLPACERREQAHCVVAWRQSPEGGAAAARTLLDRSLVWRADGALEGLGHRPALCVNPVTGARDTAAGERANLGAADASGLEWGVRPAFLPRQVSAECRGGLLWVSKPHSASFRRPEDWLAQLRAPPFNLFYADLEADARARLAVLRGGGTAPPIRDSIAVRPSPIHRIR